MQKYCKILDDETGLVQIGVGCPDEYYIEIGMEIRNVQQSDIDGEWYLTDKCPMMPILTEEEIRQAEINRINNLTMTALDFINVVKSLGLSDEDIDEYLQANIPLKNQLTYCQNVYCGVVRGLVPLTVKGVTLTDAMVVNAFKVKNGETPDVIT